MASIERTAYPRLRRLVTARELAGLSPIEDELAWARALTRTDEHLLGMVMSLKCCQRLGYSPRADNVPAPVLDHIPAAPGPPKPWRRWAWPVGPWSSRRVRSRAG